MSDHTSRTTPKRTRYTVPTILAYTIDPSTVFVNSTVSFMLTVTNPVTSGTLTLQSTDEIDVTFPASLTSSYTFLATSPGNFTVGQPFTNSPTYKINPPDAYRMVPGASFAIVFESVAVVASLSPTPASITIQEAIGDNPVAGTSVNVAKTNVSLGVVAWLTPWDVALGAPSTLTWTSTGASGVTVFGLPNVPGGQQSVAVSGKMSVTPRYTDRQTTYTLVANTNDGTQSSAFPVTQTQVAPQITSFDDGNGPRTIKVDQAVALTWTTAYAQYVQLTTPAGKKGPVNANPPLPISHTPGQEAYSGAPGGVPKTVTYTLQAVGFQQPAVRKITYTLQPVTPLWFKFLNKAADGTLSGMQWKLDAQWLGFNVVFGDVAVLKITQPGGAVDTYYLGSGNQTDPQIQYFNAAAGASNVTLSWVTANLTSLTLDPGAQVITGPNIASGSQTVAPAATTTYVLTGTAANGKKISSTLVVTVK